MKALKVIAINIGIFLGILLVVNIISATIIDGRYVVVEEFMRSGKEKADQRANLPVYEDKDRARILFEEQKESSRFSYTSYVGWSRGPYSGKAVTVNDEGDRTHPANVTNSRGTVRFFGGSALWGSGADDAGTIPAIFNQLAPDYQVLNHAESGFVSRQELARLVNIANQGQPMDLVIFYDGANDVGTLCSARLPINSHSEESRIKERVDVRDAPSIEQSLETSQLAQIFVTSTYALVSRLYDRFLAPSEDERRRNTTVRLHPSCQDSDEYARLVAMTLLENWRIARDIVEARGGRFLAVLQPIAYVGNPRVDYLTNGMYRPNFAPQFQQVYSVLKEMLDDDPVPWVLDLTNVFDGDEAIYIDLVHVSERGNELVAGRIMEEVERQGLLSPEAPR